MVIMSEFYRRVLVKDAKVLKMIPYYNNLRILFLVFSKIISSHTYFDAFVGHTTSFTHIQRLKLIECYPVARCGTQEMFGDSKRIDKS